MLKDTLTIKDMVNVIERYFKANQGFERMLKDRLTIVNKKIEQEKASTNVTYIEKIKKTVKQYSQNLEDFIAGNKKFDINRDSMQEELRKLEFENVGELKKNMEYSFNFLLESQKKIDDLEAGLSEIENQIISKKNENLINDEFTHNDKNPFVENPFLEMNINKNQVRSIRVA